MLDTVSRPTRPSIQAIEVGVAALVVALLCTYALGKVVADAVPPLHTAGVFAVHLAVLFVVVLGTLVVSHALAGALASSVSFPTVSTVGAVAVAFETAGVVLVALTGSVVDADPGLVLAAVAAGAIALFTVLRSV